MIEEMKFKRTIHKSRLLVFKGEKILTLEKVGKKKQFTFPGGVQKQRETDCHALIREVEEEIGVQLEKEEFIYFMSRRNITKDKNEVYKHYFITKKNISIVELLKPEKFKAISWIPWYQTLEYLDKEDRSTVVIYCDKYLKK